MLSNESTGCICVGAIVSQECPEHRVLFDIATGVEGTEYKRKAVSPLSKHFKQPVDDIPLRGDVRATQDGKFMYDGENWIHESKWLHIDVDRDVLNTPTQERDNSEALKLLESWESGVPEYYGTQEQDLYSLEIQHFGLDAWQVHAEMEVLQYVWRARKKGSYRQDIEKAKVILERILTELDKAEERGE